MIPTDMSDLSRPFTNEEAVSHAKALQTILSGIEIHAYDEHTFTSYDDVKHTINASVGIWYGDSCLSAIDTKQKMHDFLAFVSFIGEMYNRDHKEEYLDESSNH